MNRVDGGARDDDPDSERPDVEAYSMDDAGESYHTSAFEPDDVGEFDRYEQYGEEEPLRRQLAQFAFVREEDDREVRLTFRDVPANEIARAFRGSGALLISMMGERALSPPDLSAQVTTRHDLVESNAEEAPLLKRRSRKSHIWPSAEGAATITRPNRHTGELTMRYFFSLNGVVYTINIVAPTGIVESIASIYPAAGLSEQELQSRLAVVFREGRG